MNYTQYRLWIIQLNKNKMKNETANYLRTIRERFTDDLENYPCYIDIKAKDADSLKKNSNLMAAVFSYVLLNNLFRSRNGSNTNRSLNEINKINL